jgi:hypothetical protein
MYSYEDRLRAVQLYIMLGKRIGSTIRPLSYRLTAIGDQVLSANRRGRSGDP